MTTYYLQILNNVIVGYATSREIFPEDSQVVSMDFMEEPIHLLGQTL